jgi:MFS transporter, FSR family, fosmidomycin resistance protein
MRLSSNTLSQTFAQFGHTYCHVSMLLYPTVVLALEKTLHMSYGDLLVLMTVGNVLFGLGALPAGWLGDRWSAVGMMVIYFIGLGLALLFTGMMSSPFGLALGLALVGVFASIYHPVGMSWLIRNAQNRGRILGINGVFGSLGVAGAALTAGVLTDLISWRAAFLVPGVLIVATGLALAYCVWRGWISETKTDVRPQAKPHKNAMVRAFIVLSITMVGNGLIYQSMTSAMPKIFAERIEDWTGGTTVGAGLLVSLVYFGAMASQLIGGYLVDKVSSRTLYVAASLVQLPLYLLAASLANSPLFFVVAASVLFNTVAVPTENVLLTHYTPDKWRATAFGAKFVLALGIGALGVPLVAHIHEVTHGFYWYFMLTAGIMAVIVVSSLWLPTDKRVASVQSAGAASSALP